MNKYLYFLALTLFCVCFTAHGHSTTYSSETTNDISSFNRKSSQVDSIMRQVIGNSSLYAKQISEYHSESYIKGRTTIIKRNFLLRFAHNIIPVNRKRTDMLFEIMCNTEYNAPNNYTHNIFAINGNTLPNKDKCMEALQFLSFNIYDPTVSNDALLLPTAPNAFKYYDFKLLGIEESDTAKVYIVEFKPKRLSRNQISGTFYIEDGSFMFQKINLRGKYLFADFHLELFFQNVGNCQLMPSKGNLRLKYNLLGNKITSIFHLNRKYSRIDLCFDESIIKQQGSSRDLTQYNTIIADSLPVIRDTSFWNSKRDLPLSPEEQQIYADADLKKSDDTKAVEPNLQKYLNMTETLVSTMSFKNQNTRVRYSGIINPFQFAFSGRNGVTYKQKVRLYHTFKNEQFINIRPEIGFLFKYKELYFRLPVEWGYKPEKMGSLHLEIGNKNNSYSSEITDEINKHLKDSTFNFDDLNLKYYSDRFIELRNTFEITNGLLFYQGLSYHHRKPVKKGRDKIVGDELEELLKTEYNAFAPYIGITYTPKQYYWMDGKKKNYLHSKYPTFNIEYARSIKGLLRSNSSYERIEFGINQNIPLGLLRNFSYHLSGGFFTRQKTVYFADFTYFAPSYFPESWDEDIGGRFYTLKREWYNAATSYVQLHALYESPFLIARVFNSGRHLMNERLYFSCLWTPALENFNEIGYGFGNHIFNIAFFCGFEKLKATRMSMRFAFEI